MVIFGCINYFLSFQHVILSFLFLVLFENYYYYVCLIETKMNEHDFRVIMFIKFKISHCTTEANHSNSAWGLE